jgi:hypothetical protein
MANVSNENQEKTTNPPHQLDFHPTLFCQTKNEQVESVSVAFPSDVFLSDEKRAGGIGIRRFSI